MLIHDELIMFFGTNWIFPHSQQQQLVKLRSYLKVIATFRSSQKLAIVERGRANSSYFFCKNAITYHNSDSLIKEQLRRRQLILQETLPPQLILILVKSYNYPTLTTMSFFSHSSKATCKYCYYKGRAFFKHGDGIIILNKGSCSKGQEANHVMRWSEWGAGLLSYLNKIHGHAQTQCKNS